MPTESLTNRKARAADVVRILKETYPEAAVTLDHRSPFELLVATILAAQCTDAKVNTVTPHLFAVWPTPESLASAARDDVEDVIHPLGFFRQKARSLVEMSRDIVLQHNSEVPRTLEELTTLRGVGRKTANVILGACFTGGGVVVDTHCRRVSRRLGFTNEQDPAKIESGLMRILDPAEWPVYGHLMVWHGRAICTARNPKCPGCPVLQLCPAGRKNLGMGPLG